MANPRVKEGVKQQSLIRAAIAQAVNTKDKIQVLLDGRPCSIEIGRNGKGDLSWNVKIYTVDAAEVLETVSSIKRVENAINQHFPR